MRPVALDAMGGDHAPEATVAGAVRAARESGIAVLLVGHRRELEERLEGHAPVPDQVEVVHAETTIGMEESPGPALLRKRDSSIFVAIDLVKEGRASAVVSMGNSGAAMGAATLRLGLVPGVDRPALAMVMPSRGGGVVVLDCGAVVDCRPQHLCDFAQMGSMYAHHLLHRDSPRVGLLSVGSEESKGNTVTKKAHPLLAKLPINFVGNVEGHEIAQGEVDVVVCDGFVGNAILKATEGYAELFWNMLKERLDVGWWRRVGAWLLRPTLHDISRQLNYASYGGALLVGVKGICIIGHGRSTPAAVSSALCMASRLADQGVVEELIASRSGTEMSAVESAVGQDLD